MPQGRDQYMNKHKEELQHNELVDWLDKKFGHLRPYSNQIILGVIGAIVLVFGVAMYFKTRADRHAEQWRQLNLAIYGHFIEGKTSEFTYMAKEYPNFEASMWALQLAGDVELRNGLQKLNSDTTAANKNIKDAISLYQQLLDSNVKKSPMLQQRAVFSLAYAQESLGTFDAARTTYERILSEAPNSIYVEPAKMALQRLANPDLVAFYEVYKKTSIAPLGDLPKRPNISFPDDATDPKKVADMPATDATGAAPTTSPDGGEKTSDPTKQNESDK
jgi:tetratricopeptide (TPR) repeat protein